VKTRHFKTTLEPWKISFFNHSGLTFSPLGLSHFCLQCTSVVVVIVAAMCYFQIDFKKLLQNLTKSNNDWQTNWLMSSNQRNSITAMAMNLMFLLCYVTLCGAFCHAIVL